MKIINTYPSILKCFYDERFNLSHWRTYARNIDKMLASKCEEDSANYDFEAEVLPVIDFALSHKDKLCITNQSFINVTQLLEANLSSLFEEDLDLDIILYLGLCNGAGWATTLNNKNTILLGIEKIVELDWCDVESMQGLIFHEIGHIWHKIYGNLSCDTISQKENSIRQLYEEGIAMICEQILCKNENFFHQDKKGWLDWCIVNEKNIKNEYLSRLNNSLSTQDFFGDWCSYLGHSDVGYYLGCQFIRYLLHDFSLIEIANLSCATLIDEYETFAKL